MAWISQNIQYYVTNKLTKFILAKFLPYFFEYKIGLFHSKTMCPCTEFCKKGLLVKTLNFSKREKHENFNQNQKDNFVYETECLTKWPDSNDHFELMFMRVHSLPEKYPRFRKFENCQFCSVEMIRASVLVKFFLSWTLILLQNTAKEWEILHEVTGCWYGYFL